ncbi:EF-Tu/IF-2/RF-3 family GTPase [Streptomyces sp. NPDC051907]|uniref:EF-Tu/IF-2/RF-3 family GTPase n=1 Tax=Streptomyces sp. NPDC051907 TaxID=3155284 RepID=UPI003418272E
MAIENVSSDSADGTVVTGRIERGRIKAQDAVEVVGLRPNAKATCTSILISGKQADEGRAGETCNVLLRDIEPNRVERGQILAKPGSVGVHPEFTAEVYILILRAEEGGRATPFSTGCSPRFRLRTADVTAAWSCPKASKRPTPETTSR